MSEDDKLAVKYETILYILNSQANEGPGCEGGRDFHFPIGHFDAETVRLAFADFLATEKAKTAGITITYQGQRAGDEWYLVKWPDRYQGCVLSMDRLNHSG